MNKASHKMDMAGTMVAGKESLAIMRKKHRGQDTDATKL